MNNIDKPTIVEKSNNVQQTEQQNQTTTTKHRTVEQSPQRPGS
jgi:hypothetical protein